MRGGSRRRTTGTDISREAGAALKRERLARGWNIPELSEQVSLYTGGAKRISEKVIELIEDGVPKGGAERGVRVMSVDELKLLAAVLGIPPGRFWEEKKEGHE
jgi:hypothetical protein